MDKASIVMRIVLMAAYTGTSIWMIRGLRLKGAFAGMWVGLLCGGLAVAPAGLAVAILIFLWIAMVQVLAILYMDSAGYGEVTSKEWTEDGKGKEIIRAGGSDFSEEVLERFRKDVGRYRAETGGMLASSKEAGRVDLYHFDTHSKNTAGSFYYDVDSMTEVYRKWKEAGAQPCGIIHSHPMGMSEPSYHDISSALLHIDFFGIRYFHMPIIQTDPFGRYTLYFYEVEEEGMAVAVKLCYVLKAEEDGRYSFVPFRPYEKRYSVSRLKAYREGIDRQAARAEKRADASTKTEAGPQGRKGTGLEIEGRVPLIFPLPPERREA